MSEPRMNPSRQNNPHRLIDAYIDSTLDDAGFARLCDWLRDDEANRREFALALALHAGIADWSSDRSGGLLIPELAELGNVLAANDESGWLDVLAALDDERDQATPIDFTEELARREREREERLARAAAAQAPPEEPGPRVVVIPKAVAWGGLAAALLLVALVIWPLLPERAAVNHTDATEPTAQPDAMPAPAPAPAVGRVVRSVGAQWVGPIGDDGKLRAEQSLTLTAGLAELEFNDGARVILQAPATLQPTGANGLRLVRGQLTATCPPSAHGFTVATASGLITDLGTEFGVQVEADGSVSTHVFDGSVTYQSNQAPADAQPELLFAGQALDAAIDGTARRVHAQPAVFIRDQEFVSLVQAGPTAYGRWLAHSHQLRRDRSLLAYYVPDRTAAQTMRLPNQAAGMRGSVTLDGPTLGPGRFAEKPALYFDSNEDLARIELYDTADDFTLMSWVWIDRLGASHVALLCSDDLAQPGAIHWQLEQPIEGDRWGVTLTLGGGAEIKSGGKVRCWGGITPADAGRWVQLAVAVSREDALARFYVDGEFVNAGGFDWDQPMRLGSARIGSLVDSAAYPKPSDRHLDGRIDELLIYGEALSAERIAQDYHAGRPDSGPPPAD